MSVPHLQLGENKEVNNQPTEPLSESPWYSWQRNIRCCKSSTNGFICIVWEFSELFPLIMQIMHDWWASEVVKRLFLQLMLFMCEHASYSTSSSPRVVHVPFQIEQSSRTSIVKFRFHLEGRGALSRGQIDTQLQSPGIWAFAPF